MAWIGTAVTSLFGGGAAATAAGGAISGAVTSGVTSLMSGGTQVAGAQTGAAELREAETRAREDRERGIARLEPSAEIQDRQLSDIDRLVSDPEAQKEFVTQNPFFTALADEAQRRLLSKEATRGKIASGGTAEALQNSILLLGEDLIGRRVERGRQIVGTTPGARVAQANIDVGQAAATGLTGQGIAEFATQEANARAAGQVGFGKSMVKGAEGAVELRSKEMEKKRQATGVIQG